MTLFDNLTSNQKVRASLYRDVRAICTETCHFLGLEMSVPSTDIVAELIYHKISMYGADLEAFAKHAKRATINSEDVKLLTRRNSSLKEHLSSFRNVALAKDKRRKTAPRSDPKDTEKSTESTKTIVLTKNNTEKSGESQSNLKKSNDNVTTRNGNDMSKTKEDVLEDNMVIDDVVDLTFD